VDSGRAPVEGVIRDWLLDQGTGRIVDLDYSGSPSPQDSFRNAGAGDGARDRKQAVHDRSRTRAFTARREQPNTARLLRPLATTG